MKNFPLLFPMAGAVWCPNQAQFHPLKFVSAISRGIHIYEHTLEREIAGTTAAMDFKKITAKKIIIATHFPFLNKHGCCFLKLYQHRPHVIVPENAPYVDGMYVNEALTSLSSRRYENLLEGAEAIGPGKRAQTRRSCRSLSCGIIPML